MLHGGVAVLLLLAWRLPEKKPVFDVTTVDLVDGSPAGAGSTGAAETPAPRPAQPAPAPRSGARASSAPADLDSLLRLAEAAHGSGAPGETNNGGNGEPGAARGPGGLGALRDFIRVQIERRWQVAATAGETTVTLRLTLGPDGSVLAAETLGETLDKALALSARNAALLSSPLQFPKGTLVPPPEIVVDLNTRDGRL